jgi:hypothetical protein
MLPVRALPTPTVDVINEDDNAVLVDLEQRFKMADIDGLVLRSCCVAGLVLGKGWELQTLHSP